MVRLITDISEPSARLRPERQDIPILPMADDLGNQIMDLLIALVYGRGFLSSSSNEKLRGGGRLSLPSLTVSSDPKSILFIVKELASSLSEVLWTSTTNAVSPEANMVGMGLGE